MAKLRLIAAAALAAAAAAVLPSGTGCAYYSDSTKQWTFNITSGFDSNAVACGTYKDMTLSAAGFGQLTVTTVGTYPNDVQTYGAGYAEGVLMQERIKQQSDNMGAWILSNFKNGSIPPAVTNFFTAQDAYARSQVASNSSTFWQTTGAVLAQLDGLIAGYNAAAPSSDKLTAMQLWMLNAVGDLLDLIPAVAPDSSSAPSWDEMSDEQLVDRVRKTTHCSALVKVGATLNELYFAHVAWFIYQSTIRVFKHYQFSLRDANGAPLAGNEVSFSSYPGYLSSLDDYYSMWSSGLTLLETSNSIFNMSLYSAVVPTSLYAWQRVRIANLVAVDGPSWYGNFSYQNSGTYNNQYLVVNVGAFKPGKALPGDLLWAVEQIPGLVVGGDVTQELERGYFPSYNVPYFQEIYDLSGYTEEIKKRTAARGGELGPLSGIDYQMAPRAQIFRRDAGAVESFDAFLGIMRYNDYKNDPIAAGDPWNAICSRGDLANPPSPGGCLDGKASMASLWPARKVYAINGPTTGSLPPGGTLPPFSWAAFNSTPHEGLPAVYDFSFEGMTPAW